MDNKNKTTQTKQIIITEKDLPLCCPKVNNQATWNNHPKVYLPVKEQKNIICPYCGTEYIFVEEKL